MQERPRVGVPYRTSKEEAAGNNTKHLEYCAAIRNAGGEPVAISLQLGDAELKKAGADAGCVCATGKSSGRGSGALRNGAKSEMR